MSVICDSFQCPPSEAIEQDWRLVRDILEFRAMREAKDTHNNDASRMTEGQAALWVEMIEATNEHA